MFLWRNKQNDPIIIIKYPPYRTNTQAVLLFDVLFYRTVLLIGKKTFITYGPRQANLVLIAYASSEGSGEPTHPRSLARTFAARSYK